MAKSEAKKQFERDVWRDSLAERAEKDGFFQEVGKMHKAIYIPEEGPLGKTLVVAFDNLDDVRQDPDRMPWAVDFISAQGWSALGFMAHGPTWYRDEPVFDFFDKLAKDHFFDQFERVVFYGTSMGGYAAAAFSAACPGATVLAITPQATMDRDIAGWDKRFPGSFRRNYASRYGYAPEMAKAAEKVWVFYDPREPQDAMHATLFQSPNVIHIRCPFMGHSMLTKWRNMGILKQVVAGCINGTATPLDLYKMMRTRHDFHGYQRSILKHLVAHKKHALLIRFCKIILKTRNAPHFRNAMNDALKALGRKI